MCWLLPHRLRPCRWCKVPAPNLFQQLWKECLINHLVTSPLTALAMYSLVKHMGAPGPTEALPLPAATALLIAGAHLFNDVGFYCSHRLLHSKVRLGASAR